nr:NADH dehydrogenase subunit 1 [Tartessus sp.]
MYFFTCIFMILMIMVSVGFFTLFERKILSYIQCRKGPNKVGYLGLLQPFGDGFKLFFKEQVYPLNSNFLIYYLCPLFGLILSLFFWVIFPFFVNCSSFSYGLIFFLCCLGCGVYSLIICGWSSNSVYSMIGCIRSISQAISYEVSFSLFLLCCFILVDSYNLNDFYYIQYNVWMCFFCFPIFLCWLSCILAESNRTPYDFSEGESELVSGFNVEYGSGGFAFLFISEYSSIIFMCFITSMIFIGGNYMNLNFYFKVVFMCFFFIWIRATLPRYRYDKLMYLAWSCYLPFSLNCLIYYIFLSLMVFYHFFL